jgi:type II secretory pathway component GspD/PulD (secretin)
MKPKMLIAMLFVGLASQQWAASQTETNSVATNEPVISEPAPASQPAIIVAAPETTGTVATGTAVMPAADTNESPAATTEPQTNVENPNETAAASASVPFAVSTNVLPVQFQDVPLTTAIENLARLAGINYLLDPQIGYGQPDQSGKIKPEPTISVRWENITAQQALTAVLDNYGLQLVENPKTKIARITIQNPSAPPPLITRVIQLKNSGASNMVAAVESALTDKRSKAMPDSRTSQLVVVATEDEQNAVNMLVDQLDKPTRQVLIETKLVEISSNPSTSKGIDWSGTLAAQNISFGNGQVQPATTTFTAPGTTVTTPLGAGGATTTTTPGYTITTTTASSSSSSSSSSSTTPVIGGLIPNGLSFNTLSGLTPAIGFLNADGLHAVLSFLNQSSDAQVVSTPRIVTMDNETAHIEVTRAIPIFNITAGTANTAGGSSVTYSNVGTILQVTPRISANDYIWLKVVPEVSSSPGSDNQTIGGLTYSAPMFDYRRIETQVLIPDANTLVMGGLVRDNPQASYTKIPILGDIPILGYAFRSETKSLDKDNLLIFITPTIIKDSDFQYAPPTKFFKSRPMTIKPPLNPKSAWDNAEPYHNWSDPVPKEPGNP